MIACDSCIWNGALIASLISLRDIENFQYKWMNCRCYFQGRGPCETVTCLGSVAFHEGQTAASRNVVVHTVALLLLIRSIFKSKLCLAASRYFPQSLQGKLSAYSLTGILTCSYTKAVPRLRRMADRMSSRRFWLHPGPVRVGFVVRGVALKLGVFRVLRFFLISIIPVMCHTHSLILH
jgi:hypothetical protein